ncbi:hypothetical protein Trydic_g7514 [Trypoxylus dichotomus]
METSDSEYFESADEDFVSDDEMRIGQKQDIARDISAKLAVKVQDLGIGDVCVKVPCEKSTTEINNKVTNEIHNTRKNPSSKVVDHKNLPITVDCWEPGINYDIKEHEEKRESISVSESNECRLSKEHVSKSCEELFEKNNPTHQTPPAVSSSGFVTEDKTREISNKSKPRRPEFGIPPEIATCWVPGTANIQQPHRPHPAYLELIKKQKENEKSSNELDLNISSENSSKAVNVDGKTTIESETISSKTNTTEKSTEQEFHSEENMWDDEDWGDFDISSVPKYQVNSIENNETKLIKDEKSDENTWNNWDWEPLEPQMQLQNNQERVLSTQQTTEEKSNWGSWSSWGLSSVLNTATSLTSQVSQGITNVLETGIGAPDPAELARINKMEKEKIKAIGTTTNEKEHLERPILGFGLGNLVQGVTKLVETTSTKVISGGLDTLETIGKKTMEVLQENDPGLKRKRAFLKLDDDKPILSQVLREAKEKAEKENKELEKKHFTKKANYETLFDDHQGLVHLEALEMLSKQCDIKLQSLLESASGTALSDMQETLDQIKELCELPEEDEEENFTTDEIKEKLEFAVSEINVKITYDRLVSTWQESEGWLAKLNLNICNKNELHQQAIESLAQLTAIAVEQFHKAGELLLIKEHRSTADEADSLVQLTTTLTTLIGVAAARFSEKLNSIVAEGCEKEEINGLITNVFFEAANSSSYIQDAFQLLIPVLQVGAV